MIFGLSLLVILLFFMILSYFKSNQKQYLTKSSEPLTTELEWLEYSGQTTEELIALEGKYRTDSLVCAFEEALDRKAERVGLEGLTEEEIVILAVETLEREVNNGGYHQLFINASKYAPYFVMALNRIGCSEVADLTQQAIDLLGIKGPVSAEAVDQAMKEDNETRDEKLNEL